MGSWHEQAQIDAPVEEVWELVGDPRRYPEWVSDEVVEVTGLPTVVKGAEYEQVTRSPFGKSKTTFAIDELEDLHEIRLRCTASGWYSHWKLTEAGGGTFADVVIGMEPHNAGYRAIDAVTGKRWYRRVANASLDGLKRALSGVSSR
ncbi:MAG TPA: SRPBCC family protein [Thermoleophilaceae bacterium]|jgi:uncharacterized protein YndB with AHSA1/START domain